MLGRRINDTEEVPFFSFRAVGTQSHTALTVTYPVRAVSRAEQAVRAPSQAQVREQCSRIVYMLSLASTKPPTEPKPREIQ